MITVYDVHTSELQDNDTLDLHVSHNRSAFFQAEFSYQREASVSIVHVCPIKW